MPMNRAFPTIFEDAPFFPRSSLPVSSASATGCQVYFLYPWGHSARSRRHSGHNLNGHPRGRVSDGNTSSVPLSRPRSSFADAYPCGENKGTRRPAASLRPFPFPHLPLTPQSAIFDGEFTD